MIRHFLVILLTFTLTGIYSQIPEWQNVLPKCIFISAENLIGVSLHGAAAEEIQVKATGAQVQQRNDSTFQITPTLFQEDIKVKLYFKNILCGVKLLPVRYLPDIDLVIPGENNGVVSKKNILNVDKFTLTSLKNLDELGLVQNLRYYNMVVSDQRNVTIYSEQIQQYGIPEKLKNIILNSKSGLTIRITNVRLEGSNGYIYPVYFSKSWFITE